MKLLSVQRMKTTFSLSELQDQIAVMREKERTVYFIPDSSCNDKFMCTRDDSSNGSQAYNSSNMIDEDKDQEDAEAMDFDNGINGDASTIGLANENETSSIVSLESDEEDQSCSMPDGQESFEIDFTCRYQMCDWCYRIVDFFSASREVVSAAFNYMDRLFDMYSCDSAFNYKLACITSLYIALKVYNRKTVRTLTLSELSQGEITPSDITDMEYIILKALSYHLCPPTAWNFVGTLDGLVSDTLSQSKINVLPSSCDALSASSKQTEVQRISENKINFIVQRAYYLSELSVMDGVFQGIAQSSIAFASFLNAFEDLKSVPLVESLLVQMEQILQIKRDSKEISLSRQRLRALFCWHSSKVDMLDEEVKKEEEIGETSIDGEGSENSVENIQHLSRVQHVSDFSPMSIVAEEVILLKTVECA
mmetsp:Transcript_19352/g.28549  ORF Transcript_19352/g.28549 Transcript_19352/m.28549 type:complete len:422 (+) Transcript_19352:101-1366(+)